MTFLNTLLQYHYLKLIEIEQVIDLIENRDMETFSGQSLEYWEERKSRRVKYLDQLKSLTVKVHD